MKNVDDILFLILTLYSPVTITMFDQMRTFEPKPTPPPSNPYSGGGGGSRPIMTSYLAMNILVNLLSNANSEICAQAAAKINAVLHNKPVVNFEEACYLLANIDAVVIEHLNNGNESNKHMKTLLLSHIYK